MPFKNQIDRILNHLHSKSDNNSEGAYYCGHEIKSTYQLKNMYKKCRICRSCLRWPLAKTVKCQNCFLTSHETCMKSIMCPLGGKSDDRPMNIFESEVYTGQPWMMEDQCTTFETDDAAGIAFALLPRRNIFPPKNKK